MVQDLWEPYTILKWHLKATLVIQEHLIRTLTCGWGLTRVNTCPRVWLFFLTFSLAVWNHGDKPACFLCKQSLPADLLSLRTGLSSGCTSATLHYYRETPWDICQDVSFPWKLPPFKSASSVPHLNDLTADELKSVAFRWWRHPSWRRWRCKVHPHEYLARLKRWTTTRKHSTSPALGPSTPLLHPAPCATSSACVVISHVVPGLVMERLESCW